jgi:hypothetical protein
MRLLKDAQHKQATKFKSCQRQQRRSHRKSKTCSEVELLSSAFRDTQKNVNLPEIASTTSRADQSSRTEQEQEMDRWLARPLLEISDRLGQEQISSGLEQLSWATSVSEVRETASLPRLDLKCLSVSAGVGTQSERRPRDPLGKVEPGLRMSLTERQPYISNNILPQSNLVENVLTHFLINGSKQDTIVPQAKILLQKFYDCHFAATSSMTSVPISLGNELIRVPVTLSSITACKEVIKYLIEIFPQVIGRFLQISMGILDRFIFDPHFGENNLNNKLSYFGLGRRARQRLKCYAAKFDSDHMPDCFGLVTREERFVSSGGFVMTKSRVLAGYVAIECANQKMIRFALFTEGNRYFQISVGEVVLARIREIHHITVEDGVGKTVKAVLLHIDFVDSLACTNTIFVDIERKEEDMYNLLKKGGFSIPGNAYCLITVLQDPLHALKYIRFFDVSSSSRTQIPINDELWKEVSFALEETFGYMPDEIEISSKFVLAHMQQKKLVPSYMPCAHLSGAFTKSERVNKSAVKIQSLVRKNCLISKRVEYVKIPKRARPHGLSKTNWTSFSRIQRSDYNHDPCPHSSPKFLLEDLAEDRLFTNVVRREGGHLQGLVQEGKHWDKILTIEQKRSEFLDEELLGLKNQLNRMEYDKKNLKFTKSVLNRKIHQVKNMHKELMKKAVFLREQKENLDVVAVKSKKHLRQQEKEKDELMKLASVQFEELEKFKIYGQQNLVITSEFTQALDVFIKEHASFARVVRDWKELKASRKSLVTRKLKNDAVLEGWEYAMVKLVENVDEVKRCMTPRPNWEYMIEGLPELESVAELLKKQWPLSYELPWQEPIVLEAEQFSHDKFEELKLEQSDLYDVSIDKEKETSHLQNCCEQLSKILQGVENESISITEASTLFEECVKIKEKRPKEEVTTQFNRSIVGRKKARIDSTSLTRTNSSKVLQESGTGSGFSCTFVSVIKQRLKEVKESESIAAQVVQQRQSMLLCEKELVEVRQQLDEYLKMETVDYDIGDASGLSGLSRYSFDDDESELVGLGTSDNVNKLKNILS